METERKEKQAICEICEGRGTIHVDLGWKDYSFHCPKCRPGKFRKGVANTDLSEKAALALIYNYRQPGDG